MITLEVLSEQIRNCHKCSLRNIDEPLVGKTQSDLMIICENPNQEELLLSSPFEEREGFLFKKILKEANLDYNSIYMTYLVKCFSNNENTIKKAISPCKQWIWEELNLLRPKVIILLGKLPIITLLKLPKTTILKKVIGNSYKMDYLPNSAFYPWYSHKNLVQKGDWFSKQTLQFLKSIRRKLDYVQNV